MDTAGAVYAHALYDAAEDVGRQEQIGRQFAEVVQALVESPELTRVLFNPAVPPESKRIVLRRLTDGGDPLVQRTLLVLLDHGRLGLLPDVERAYAARYAAEHDELDVELVTAVPIADEQADRLRAQIEGATGQTVRLRRVVDPTILGGVVLRVRDRLVDASVRRRLETLRLAMKSTRLPA